MYWKKKKNTVNKVEENEPEKLNKLLKTDYAKVKNKNKNGGNHTQAGTATLFRHLNEQGYIQVFHDNNRDFKSRTLFVGGERCPVALFESFVERRPLLKRPCDGLFFSTSVANETENLNIWSKLNQWAKIP